MRFTLSGPLAALLISLLYVTSPLASPFDRVPQENPAYHQLAMLEMAGLLEEYELPAGELSRLEVAVLVRHGLNAYGAYLLDGGLLDTASEVALAGLLEEFGAELAQLGAQPVMPAVAPSAACTAEVECEAVCHEEIAVNLYGDFYLQAQSASTDHVGGTSSEFGDVALYWGELGWDAAYDKWSARFSFLWDAAEDEAEVHEAWARYLDPGNGWFFQIGQVVLPFGNNEFFFPTFPATRDLGYTTAHTVGAGIEQGNFGLYAHAFNPVVDGVSQDESVDEFTVVMDLAKQQADACQDGWQLTGGYTTHLPEHSIQLAGGGPLSSEVAAYNLFGRYDWGGNRCHLLADYTAALDEYELAELDTNGDGVGDKPSALNLEFVYEPKPDMLWGFSYQLADELTDYADERYGVMYGERLNKMVMLKLEYTHGEYDAFIADTQDSDDTFVAEFNIAF